MFLEPKYVSSTFVLRFSRRSDIRRQANVFEDTLSSQYKAPQTVPVPDDMPPEIPRFVFESHGGHSHVQVTQTSITLEVRYSGDYCTDAGKREKYLRERVLLMAKMLESVSPEPLSAIWCGLSNGIRIESTGSNEDILAHISDVFLDGLVENGTHDFYLRTARVVDGKYFCNGTVENYRAWDAGKEADSVRFAEAETVERGINLTLDFNSRYAFNESIDLEHGSEFADELIGKSLAAASALVEKTQEGDTQ